MLMDQERELADFRQDREVVEQLTVVDSDV
jgi:hypothetical protein